MLRSEIGQVLFDGHRANFRTARQQYCMLLLTLPSITATQELVVPKSMPMISPPPDAWLAALALHSRLVSLNPNPTGLDKHCRCILHTAADLNALKSKGPVLRGLDASDNCAQQKQNQHWQSVKCVLLAQISTAVILDMQQSRLVWPKQTPRPARPLFPTLAETSLQSTDSADNRPCEAA